MKLTFYNEVIQFDYELGTLIRSSEDPMFTQYLSDIKNDIQNNPGRVPEYRQQVIDNYNVYSDKMNKLGCPVERLFFKAVYGDMEAPEIKNPMFSAKVPEPAPVTSTGSTPMPGTVPTADSALDPQPIPAARPAAFDPYTGRPLTQPVQNINVSSASKSKKTEFAVGAIVMSIIGSVFLLTGLVYFSINFLDTFAQGMVMYLVCAIVLCVSEFVIRRIVPKLSAVFTAIGISGVFLTTVVNYRSLGNLNLPVTAIILAVCAVLVCFFGYIRKSQLYSIIGFLAAFISSIAIGGEVTPTEYIVITLGTLIISSIWLLFPVEKYYSAVTPVMLGAEMVYMVAGFIFKMDTDSDFAKNFLKIVFLVCSITVINFIYYIGAKRSDKSAPGEDVASVFSIILYSFAILYGTFMITAVIGTLGKTCDLNMTEKIILGIVMYLILVIEEGVFVFLVKDKNDKNFVVMYTSFQVMGLILLLGPQNTIVQAVLLVIHILISRYMTRYDCVNVAFKAVDLVLHSVFICCALGIAFDTNDIHPVQKYIGCSILIAGLAASMFIGIGFINIIEILSVFTITIILGSVVMPEGLGEAVSMGVLLLFTFLINNISRIKGKNFYVFNWFALVWSVIILIFASHNDYSAEEILVFTISAVFGLALVILLMNKEYGMPFHGKYIIIPAYLTFISFLIPLDNGFVLSIILMAIAVISVVIGFVLKEKSIRIYGLILSIVICGKIALVDFVSIGDIRSKTIMYILVGALALAIGCIYMVLEARESKAAKAVTMTQAPVNYQPVQPQYAHPTQNEFVSTEGIVSNNNISVEGNTENKELYEENKID